MIYQRRGRAFRPISIYPSAFCTSKRTDSPYNTQSGNIVTSQSSGSIVNYQTGLSAGFSSVDRKRFGASFPLASSYAGASKATLQVTLGNYISTLETFFPNVYVSGTDDSALYSTTAAKTAWDWEAAIGPNGGFFPYGITTMQLMNVPLSWLTPVLGTHLSIVLSTAQDFGNAGAASSGGTGDAFFQLQGATVTTLNINLLIE